MDKSELVQHFKLAEKIPLQLTEVQQNELLDFNQFYLKGRYPEDKSEYYKLCTLDFARTNFAKIKNFYQWLLTKL